MSDIPKKIVEVEGHKYKLITEERPFRSPFGKRWTKMALDFMSNQLAQDMRIHLADMRVLLKIMGTMGIGDCKGRRVFVNQAGIAKDLKMKPSNVSRSVKKLLTYGYLERGDGVDKRYYSVNPWMAWYGGDNEAHANAIKRQKTLLVQ